MVGDAGFIAVIKFRGMGDMLRRLAEYVPELEGAVRSIYLGPIDEKGVREGVLELETTQDRLSWLITRLSRAPGVIETRVESFPAAVLRDATYRVGEE